MLELLVFKNRLDHEINALEIGGVGGRGDARQQGVAALLCGAAPLQRLGLQLFGVALAFSGGLKADIFEYHLIAGLGRDVGDAGAHHARTQHTDPLDRGLADAFGPRPAGIDGLQVEEERLHHVLGDLAGDQRREVAALDAAGGVEIDLCPLDRGGQDGPRRRHRGTLELLAQVRRERRQNRRQTRRRRGAAGHLVALLVPRLHPGTVGVGLELLLYPSLGGGHQLLDRCHQLVDQTDLLGLGRLEPGTLRQHAHERVLDAEHPYRAGHPTATRQQTQRHLRQTELAALDVGGDPVMTRQRDLQAAAQRRPVDGRDDRLTQCLQGAQLPLDGLDGVEYIAGVLGPGLDHRLDVAAGEEGFLRAGDYHSGDRILFGDKAIDGLAHRLDVGLVHHVG